MSQTFPNSYKGKLNTNLDEQSRPGQSQPQPTTPTTNNALITPTTNNSPMIPTSVWEYIALDVYNGLKNAGKKVVNSGGRVLAKLEDIKNEGLEMLHNATKSNPMSVNDVNTSNTSTTDKEMDSRQANSKYVVPSELGDKYNVQAFQDWLDEKYPNWHKKYGTLKQNVGKGYGLFGPSTYDAWSKHRDEYLGVNANSGTTNNTSTPSDNFPECVKKLKFYNNPPYTYYKGYGTGDDDNSYVIYYFNTTPKNADGYNCIIYKYGEKDVINGYWKCDSIGQQIIVKTFLNPNLTIMGSTTDDETQGEAKAKENLKIQQAKKDDETLIPNDDELLQDNKTYINKKKGI